MAGGKPEQLLTVEQVADTMQVAPETVRRWLRLHQHGQPGGLRGVQLARRSGWRIQRRDLEAFIEQRSAPQTGGQP
jgi:excisionase family DNA binding protein